MIYWNTHTIQQLAEFLLAILELGTAGIIILGNHLPLYQVIIILTETNITTAL